MRKVIVMILTLLAFVCSCSQQDQPASKSSGEMVKKGSTADQTTKAKKALNPMMDIEFLTKVIKEQPRNPLAYNNRGTAYHGLKQHELAVADYNKAISLKADYADAYNNRGVAYYSLGKHQQAIEDFNQAIRLKQNFASAYANRGLTYLNQDKRDLGCADTKKACELGICSVLKDAQSKNVCP